VITENYIVFKQFLRYFTLSQRLKKTDIPAQVNIMQLIKDNIDAMVPTKSENLMPFCFFTDGGSYNDDHYYFLHNIFQKTGVCHSTRVPSNSNVQAYIGRKILVDPSKLIPKNFKVKSTDNNTIMIPYQQFVTDNTEEETYK
jgi:hypothetical protein